MNKIYAAAVFCLSAYLNITAVRVEMSWEYRNSPMPNPFMRCYYACYYSANPTRALHDGLLHGNDLSCIDIEARMRDSRDMILLSRKAAKVLPAILLCSYAMICCFFLPSADQQARQANARMSAPRA